LYVILGKCLLLVFGFEIHEPIHSLLARYHTL
jgi:hypothetical protein